MSTKSATESSPHYVFDFYDGSTLVGTLDRTQIVSFEIRRSIFSDKPTVGQANAGELTATFFMPSFTIPRMARIEVAVIQGFIGNMLGVFFIDTRKYNPVDNTLTVHCYDAMLKCEQLCPANGTDINVVNAIATAIGVSVHSSVTSAIVNAYSVPQKITKNRSAREILKMIGAAYGGSFYITKAGLLGFAGFVIPAESFLLVNEDGDAIVFGSDRIIVGGINV